MSYVKPERRPASFWRCRAATIGQMIDHGWVVWSVCGQCFLTMQVDLAVMEFLLGESGTLWNREAACRRVGCSGVTVFHGVPPETNQCMALKAEWPAEWANEPPTVPPRRSAEERRPPHPRPRLPNGSVARRPREQ